jgi:hypothetical protein
MIRHNIPEPKVSPNFTIDDIHEIREWNYERFKDSTTQERMEYYHSQTEESIKKLGLTNIKRLKG